MRNSNHPKALAAVLALGAMSTGFMPVRADEPSEEQITVVVRADESEQKSEAPKLWLGISLKQIEGDLARYLGHEKGILVDSVYPESPASSAGILEGDILLTADGTELDEPQALLKIMQSFKADDQPKSVNLVLLRKGEKVKAKLTPAARPAMEEMTIEDGKSLELHLTQPDEQKDALAKGLHFLRRGGAEQGMDVFRLGAPAFVWKGEDDTKISGDMDIVVVKDVDGEKVEVKIHRVDDKPAQITVTADGKVSEYTEEDLAKLPEDINKLVAPMLGGKGRVHVFSGQDGDKRFEGRIHIVGPDGNLKLAELMNKETAESARAMAHELAQKYRAQADELATKARESVGKVRGAIQETAKMPAELAELRSLVDELRKEVSELRSKLDKGDK